jgi:hypothetical protein
MTPRAIVPWLVVALLALSCANGGSDDSSATGGDDASVGDDTSCVTPMTACGSACVDLASDLRNCGKCGNACGAKLVCGKGSCGDTCPSPQTMCGLAAEAGAPHEAGASDGGADATTLDSGAKDSGSSAVDAGGGVPYCATLSTDPANCGSCGHDCGKGHVCTNGVCSLACGGGTVACVAGDTCIPAGTCCTSADCKIPSQVCLQPGTQCACPGGEHMCAQTNACISSNECCTNADCPAQGSSCPTPGGSCQCPGQNTVGGSCGAATPEGPLALGQTLTATGNLSTPVAEDWVAVTFGGDHNNKTYHPSVAVTGGSAGEFVFDIVASCGGAQLACGDGGNCTGKTTWEVMYGAQATGKYGDPGWQGIPAVGTVYVRVYRGTGPVTCDQFTLTMGD